MSSAQILTYANRPWWNQLGSISGTTLESDRRAAMDTIDSQLRKLAELADSVRGSNRDRARAILDSAASVAYGHRRIIASTAVTTSEEVAVQLRSALNAINTAKSQINAMATSNGGGGGTTTPPSGNGGEEPEPPPSSGSNRTLLIGGAVAIIVVGALILYTR